MSKRLTLHKRHKIERKVREHGRKLRKENALNGQKSMFAFFLAHDSLMLCLTRVEEGPWNSEHVAIQGRYAR
jgi:hypothetical protein